jgi:hypothetical protein
LAPIFEELAVAGGLLVIVFAALEAGFRRGRRVGRRPNDDGQVGAVQGAVLGLLGLLLAFSFAGAGGRFLERQDQIVMEANAIGTAYLRADLLDEPHRSELRAALQAYTEQRLRMSNTLRAGPAPAALEEVDRFHARIWQAAVAGVEATPAVTLAVLNPVNEVIDRHSLRLAASRKHIPGLVMALLILSSMIAIAAMGYGCGLGDTRRVTLTGSLAVLIAMALWITIDLDHPRAGLIQLSDRPLESLRFEVAQGR